MFSITIRERSGQVYTFHFDKPEVLIGRVKGNDVILPKQNISKRHAMVRVQGARFIVEDLGSTNGTYVNGHRIANAVEIGTDDKVYLGDFVMNFLDLAGGAVGDMPPVPDAPEIPELPVGQPSSLPHFKAEMAQSPRETALQPIADLAALDLRAEPELQALFDDQLDLAELGDLSEPPPMDDLDAFQEMADLGDFEGLPLPAAALPEPPLVPDDFGLDAFTVPEKKSKRERNGPTHQSPASAIDESTRAYSVPLAPETSATAVPADRLTGPIDSLVAGLASAPAIELPRPAPAVATAILAAVMPGLAAVPGLAGALKMPPPPMDGKGKRTAQYDRAVPEPQAPVAPPPSVAEVQGPANAHFDALAVLYRSAFRDLRPAVPGDAAQMSDSEWAEMEDRVMAFVDAAVHVGEVPADADVSRLKRDLIYEMAGLGPLEPMLDDPTVESIEVNGPAQVFVFRKGRREPVAERFSCQQALSTAVDRLVRATGNPVHKGALHADGTLIDGTTVRVVWPPLCPQGPAVLLRKPRTEAPTLELLVERGAVTEKAATILRYLVAERRSLAICGAPNAGRRTIVNALAQLLDAEERIVVVEDGQRLRLTHEHVVRMDSAAVPEEGPSALQIARRLMPDRLLMGECLSVSTAELFTVAADGLPPWIASFHARSIDDFVERATHAIVIAHPGIPEAVARSRVTRAVDAVACFEFDHESGRDILRSVAVLNTTGFGPPFKWLSPEDFEGASA